MSNTKNRTSIITGESLSEQHKKIWDEMFSCRDEIEKVLYNLPLTEDRFFCGSDVDICVASYLISKAATYNNPFEVKLSEVLSTVDEDIACVAISDGYEDVWDALLSLLKKYPVNYFKAVPLIRNLSDANSTPSSIGIISEELLEIEEEDSFADLCCGEGSVTIDIKKNNLGICASGYETNQALLAKAKVESELSELDINFETKDVFQLVSPANKDKKKFDKIFSNYPFGMKLKKQDAEREYLEALEKRIPSMSKATSSDWLYNMLMVDLLADSGKAVGVMTNGSTWNRIDAPIRKYFVENGLVETVIALPAKLFGSTSVATSLIVFSHGNEGVRLVDASEIYTPGRRINELYDEHIDKILNMVDTDSDLSMFIPNEELRENEYVLNLSRYAGTSNDIEDGVIFDSIIKRITRGAPLKAEDLDKLSSPVPTDAQYLMLANIKDGLIDKDLPYIREIDKKNEKYCLSNHCLILSKNGYPYKIAVAEIKDGQKIMANGNLYIIELDETKVNPYYIAAFLGSEIGTATLKSITVGATVPNIGVDQLKNIIIPVPSMEEQNRIADTYMALKDEVTLLQLKLEKARNKMVHIFDEGGEN